MAATVTLYGNTRTIQVGSVLWPDNWTMGTPLKSSDFPGAAYRIDSVRYPDISMCVNVTITGRTIQRKAGDNWLRCKIEFVHDGEPSTEHTGWLRVDSLGWE